MRSRAELSKLSVEARRDTIVEYLRAITAAMFETHPNQIKLDDVWPDPRQLFKLIRPLVLSDLGFPLYQYDLPSCTSLRLVAEHLAQELAPEPIPVAPIGELYDKGTWAWGSVDRTFASSPRQAAVFVLSAPRSGSTLLRVMLAGHPNLFAPPELHLLPFDSMKRRRTMLKELGYTWMRHGILSAMRELTPLTPREAERELDALEDRDTPVTELFERLQELAEHRILVDKSPTYAFHPAWLGYAERAFRNAYYIHLVRHPNAAIESFVRMRLHRVFGRHWLIWDENAWLYAEKCWTSANLHILNFLRQVEAGRQLRVSYEQLVTNPAVITTRICDFLQVPFNPAVLSPYSGACDIHDYNGKGAAIGDPNFLNHSTIDSSLAWQWTTTHPLQPLGPATREIARELNYTIH